MCIRRYLNDNWQTQRPRPRRRWNRRHRTSPRQPLLTVPLLSRQSTKKAPNSQAVFRSTQPQRHLPARRHLQLRHPQEHHQRRIPQRIRRRHHKAPRQQPQPHRRQRCQQKRPPHPPRHRPNSARCHCRSFRRSPESEDSAILSGAVPCCQLSASLLPLHPTPDASGQRQTDNIFAKPCILSVLCHLHIFGIVHAERKNVRFPKRSKQRSLPGNIF